MFYPGRSIFVLLRFSLIIMGLLTAPFSFADSEPWVSQDNPFIRAYQDYLGDDGRVSALYPQAAYERELNECKDYKVDLIIPVRLLSRPQFTFVCFDNGKTRKMRIRAVGEVRAVTASGNISPNSMALGSQLQYKNVGFASARHGTMTQKRNIFGRQVIRSIRSGDIIMDYYLDNKYDVLEGQSIKLKRNSSGLSFEMTVISLESGVVGDSIKVKNRDSGKVFMATISSSGEVTI